MANKEKTSLKLEVYSDVICPWCYVGKARLDKALDSIGSELDVHVEWMPFELNPSMPEGGMDRRVFDKKVWHGRHFTNAKTAKRRRFSRRFAV